MEFRLVGLVFWPILLVSLYATLLIEDTFFQTKVIFLISYLGFFTFKILYSQKVGVIASFSKLSTITLWISYLFKWSALTINPALFVRINSEGSIKYVEYDVLNSMPPLLAITIYISLLYIFLKLSPSRSLHLQNKGVIFGFISLLFIAIRLVLMNLLNWGHGNDFASGWLSNLLPYSSLFFLCNFLRNRLKNVILGLLIVSGVILGSRSVLLSVFMAWLFAQYLSRPKVLIRFSAVFLIILAGASTWLVSSHFRGGSADISLIELGRVVTRLGAPFDSLYVITNSNVEQFEEAQNFVYNFTDRLRYVVNAIVPGELFAGAYHFSGNIFKEIWFGESLQAKQGDVWSSLGYLYVHGRLVAIMLFSIIILGTVRFLVSLSNLKGSLYLFFIYFLSYGWHQVGMLDAALLDLVYFALQLTILMFLLILFNHIFYGSPKRI